MDRFLILHGWGGSDYPHWQAWLAAELAKDYGTVSFPLIMHPHHPNRKRWSAQVVDHLNRFLPTTVICHSLACTLWFWLCKEEKIKGVERVLLVSPPGLNTDIELLKSFFPAQLPKELFADEALMVVSDDDPYIDKEEAETMTRFLGIDIVWLHGAGHINEKSGYGEWPWVLNWCRREV